MTIVSYNPPPLVKQWRQRALITGAVGTLLLLIGLFLNPDQFFRSYLFAFSFWAGISVGSLAFLMLQHLTGGNWGLVIRRVLEASTRTLPLAAFMFLPILLGARRLYRWTDAAELAKSEALKVKSTYLNLHLFTARAVIYFAIWLLLAFLLNRWSTLQDQTADRQYTKRMKALSGPGMVVLIFAVTFAAIDWFMSLEPEWYSTIYGFIFLAAWAVSALAFTIAVMALLYRAEPMSEIVVQSHFHDLGKLLLALVMLWTYFAFSQFLIIWSGNLPEEIHYYLPRINGVWGAIALAVVLLHFAFPFLFLLSRSLKRNAGKLALVASLVLVMRLIDFYWVLAPSFLHEHFHLSWMDIVAPIGLGGLWLAMFAWELSKRPLIPINDPQYESLLEQKHAHAGH